MKYICHQIELDYFNKAKWIPIKNLDIILNVILKNYVKITLGAILNHFITI